MEDKDLTSKLDSGILHENEGKIISMNDYNRKKQIEDFYKRVKERTDHWYD